MVDLDERERHRWLLTRRYWTGWTGSSPVPSAEAVAMVATVASTTVDTAPLADDIYAALALLADARETLDYCELVLLDAGRRADLTWKTLGGALGHTTPAARSATSTRARRLLARWPGYHPQLPRGLHR
ncbi:MULTISPECIES: hypothetical protein [unclassified Parafrankia]|uniref:hypothetical protein n=1 Tax=unclassified Parafrankia TaxID=2994368 RepID=UPI000DA47CE9|nr:MULTISPECIES: hypothetical protein [unclassified Parafrankia]TCJ33253.1 hypothetical protein E0504_39090 [Parafrankia sp. BMG5.11]SQD99418.1 hypothetical protein FMEAI12_5270031 [Parafrankia sp. Ea1.12]